MTVRRGIGYGLGARIEPLGLGEKVEAGSRRGVNVSMGKGDANRRYAIHGDGLASIRAGLNVLAMPQHRRAEAFSIVSEVLGANRVVEFRWYKTDGHNELACYWDDQPTNVLWVTPRKVHIPAARGNVTRPTRPVTWEKDDGEYVGWLLPEA